MEFVTTQKDTQAPPDRRRALVVSDNAPAVDVYRPEDQPPDADPVAGTARTMNRCGAGPT